jgi:hypothetical protein
VEDGVSGKWTVRVRDGEPMDYSGRVSVLARASRALYPTGKVAKENSSCRHQKQNAN